MKAIPSQEQLRNTSEQNKTHTQNDASSKVGKLLLALFAFKDTTEGTNKGRQARGNEKCK